MSWSASPPKQWRGNCFWTGGEGQNRERQIDGIFIEFGPRFCPRNERSLKKGLCQIWTAFCPTNKCSLKKEEKNFFAGFRPCFCPRSKCSLKQIKKRSSPTSDCVCLAQNTVFRGGASFPGGPKYLQGKLPPAPLLPAPMLQNTLESFWTYEFEWFCWVSHLTKSQCSLLYPQRFLITDNDVMISKPSIHEITPKLFMVSDSYVRIAKFDELAGYDSRV